MSDELAFDYEALRYIELRGDGSRLPAKEWGGYSQDFDEAEHVYTHDQVKMVPGREWGVVDVEDIEHGSMALLIFDLDIYKAPDNFDASRIEVPNDTLIVKSQSGGLHVYFKVNGAQRGEYAESDFSLTTDLPGDADIDIRGSTVSHHVVAPSDIPGVGGDYEVVNNEPIKAIGRPTEACERITFDGEPLLEFDQRTSVGDFEFDRPTESPEDIPTCYHAGLELRKAAPDDHPNTHKVNVLTALCGLAAGYGVKEVVGHFVNEYAPGDECDVGKTEYQVKHLARNLDSGHYSPPSESTLRDYGILGDGESCDGDCPIDYHGPNHSYRGSSTAHEGLAARSDGGVAVGGASDPSPSAPGAALPWDQIRNMYADSETEDDDARYQAVIRLCEEFDFAMVAEADELYIYHEPTGVFERGGQRDVERELQSNLGPHYSQFERREVLGHIKARSYIERDELNAGGFDEPLLCVGNGVLNVETREFYEHEPKYKFVRSIPWDYNPDADAPNLEQFMDDITQREADKLTMYEMVGHALHPEYVEKKFMVLFGPGDNGKTVFYKFVSELLGGLQNISGVELQKIAENSFASSTIVGSFANIAPDMAAKKVSDLGDLKTLTGGEDPYFFEPKGKQGFEAVNTATMMFGCNEPPILPERGRAVKKRLVPIRLPYEFVSDPDANNEFEKQLRPASALKGEVITEEEMSGFLNKALDGLDRLIENNDVSLPETLDQRLEVYEQSSDPIKKFAVNYLENKSDVEIAKDDIYNTYVEFCRREDVKVTSRNMFFKQLRQTTLNYSDYRPRTGGGEREGRVKNVTLSELGREIAADVLLESVDAAAAGDNGDSESEDNDRFDPLPLHDVAKDPTGYPTVEGEIRTIEFPEPENAPAVKATLVDRSTVIDLVSWDNRDVLEHVGEEEVIVENAEISEYNGRVQLVVRDGITEIHKAPADGQQQIGK
jgi:P4 family phage/plasmid primase-like protien